MPAEIVYRDEQLIALADINPEAPTHLLILPVEHISSVNDLGPEHKELIGAMTLLAAKLAAEAGHSEKGYRLVMNCGRQAGQTVNHLHMHMLGGRFFTWPPG